jgi:hypothetical protein
MNASHIQTHSFFISFPSVCANTLPTSWRASDPAKSGWTCSFVTTGAWASFPPVILHFGSDISDESLCTELPLVRYRCRFPLLRLFSNRSNLCSFKGLVTLKIFDNFLNILKLFVAVESDFTKSLWQRMDGIRRERKMANQLRRSWWQMGRGGWSNIFGKCTVRLIILYSWNLSTNCSVRYSRCPGCKYPHLVHQPPWFNTCPTS